MYTFSWYFIKVNMVQRSRRAKRKNVRGTEDGVSWNDFEYNKCLGCGTAYRKMGMSMMVPDEVDMELKVVKCGMCIVTEMNVGKGDNELLRKEVGGLMKEVGELRMDVGELRLKNINKDKEVTEVKIKEEDSNESYSSIIFILLLSSSHIIYNYDLTAHDIHFTITIYI